MWTYLSKENMMTRKHLGGKKLVSLIREKLTKSIARYHLTLPRMVYIAEVRTVQLLCPIRSAKSCDLVLVHDKDRHVCFSLAAHSLAAFMVWPIMDVLNIQTVLGSNKVTHPCVGKDVTKKEIRCTVGGKLS